MPEPVDGHPDECGCHKDTVQGLLDDEPREVLVYSDECLSEAEREGFNQAVNALNKEVRQ